MALSTLAFRLTAVPASSRAPALRHQLLHRPATNSAPRLSSFRCMAASTDTKYDKNTPDSKWKEILSAEEYNILRSKGTERPGTGEFNKHKETGQYTCAGCGTTLYTSETKFDSGCGWPAFYAEIDGTVDRHVDRSFGSERTEITCKNCGGHLGHVFKGEGFDTPTDARHCVNSKSLKFQKK